MLTAESAITNVPALLGLVVVGTTYLPKLAVIDVTTGVVSVVTCV